VRDCKACGGYFIIEDIRHINVCYDEKTVFLSICLKCLTEHNSGQLSIEKQRRLEEVRLSFPIQARAIVRNMLTNAF